MIHNLLVAAPDMMAPHKRAKNIQWKVDRDILSLGRQKRKKKTFDFVVISANMVVLLLTHIVVSLVFQLFSFECMNH